VIISDFLTTKQKKHNNIEKKLSCAIKLQPSITDDCSRLPNSYVQSSLIESITKLLL